MNTTKEEKSIKRLFVGKCWTYLHDNFHKFSDTNKLKVALELAKKSLPQEISGTLGHVVKMGQITVGGEPLDFNIGEPIGNDTPEDTGHPKEASPGSQ
jgi:hypothetical protein